MVNVCGLSLDPRPAIGTIIFILYCFLTAKSRRFRKVHEVCFIDFWPQIKRIKPISTDFYLTFI